MKKSDIEIARECIEWGEGLDGIVLNRIVNRLEHLESRQIGSAKESDIVGKVLAEYRRATSKFPQFNSPHEGYAILLEEVDELWKAIKRNDWENMEEEAIQVAAMGIRFLMDVVFNGEA